MNKPEKATVDTIAEAKTGDWLWIYDQEAPRYDPAGKWQGRGNWRLWQVESETKQSFIIGRAKYNRFTGEQRVSGDRYATIWIYGETEKVDHEWYTLNRHRVADAVSQCRDVSALRKIDAILAAVPEDAES